MDREKLMDLLFVNFNFYSKEYREEVADKIIALEKQECLSEDEIADILHKKVLGLTNADEYKIAKLLSGKIPKPQECNCQIVSDGMTLGTITKDCPKHGKLEWKKPSNLIDFNKQPEKPKKLEYNENADWYENIKICMDAINTINERIRGEE